MNSFNLFLKGWNLIGGGSEDSCYQNQSIVLKFFDGLPHINYTEDIILKYKDLNIKSYNFAKAILYIEDEIKGYLMPYAQGETLYVKNMSLVTRKKLISSCSKIVKDTKKLSNMGINADDIYFTNILYDDKTNSFSVVDTAEFYNSENDPDLILRRNAQLISSCIVRALFHAIKIRGIKKDSSLYKLYLERNNITDLIDYIEQLFEELSIICDKEIKTIRSANKCFIKK